MAGDLQAGATYARFALALAVPLGFLLVVGVARSTFDPPFDPARRPAASAAPPPAHAPRPPRLSRAVPLLPPSARALPIVSLARGGIYLGDVYVAPAPGEGPAAKHRGRSELRIGPLADMLESARPPPGADGEQADGLRLLVHEDATYRAFVEVLHTVGQARYSTVYLLAQGPGQEGVEAALEWQAPRYRGRHYPVGTLSVDVLALPAGVALRTDTGPVGPGCEQGSGLTFPGLSRERIVPELQGCLAKLQRSRPEAAGPVVTLTASPDVPIGVLYEALLATSPRSDERAEGPVNLPALAAPVSPESVEAWQSPPELDARLRERTQRAALVDALGLDGVAGPAASGAVVPKALKLGK